MKTVLIATVVALLMPIGLGSDTLQLKQGTKDFPIETPAANTLADSLRELASQNHLPQFEESEVSPAEAVRQLLPNGDFEQGSASWTVFSTNGWPVIYDSSFLVVPPYSGNWAAWMGGDYDETTVLEQRVTIPSEAPYFGYRVWIASQDFCGYDVGGVVVNGDAYDAYWLCDDTNTGGWVLYRVTMASYAGQTVDLAILVGTDDSLNSNMFVDDVFLEHEGSPPVDVIFEDGFESGDTSAWSATTP